MDLFSSVGTQEILMILLVAIIVIGPNKIAEFGKTLGNVSRNLKKASSDFTTSITREIEEEEKEKKASTPVMAPPDKKA
jgi:sec-independent protein translocase protein TatB